MDAISFVLGLKAAHLRSSNLTHLINTNADSASVSLILEEKDNTIKFSRRFTDVFSLFWIELLHRENPPTLSMIRR
jgi:chromosome segregation ATPase